MAYSYKTSKGKTYYLHSREVTLKGGRKQRIYYFAGEIKKDALDKLPAGYKVVENKRTGLPMLKKSK
jgi:YHS domain-containing protein